MKEIFEKQYIDARREYIRSQFSNLNEMQQEAVCTTEGPLLILAGAGSGKTTVLIHRIANLLKYGKAGDSKEIPMKASERDIDVFRNHLPEADTLAALDRVEPWRIMAITFTNKAAGELKNRLSLLLGEESADIWACTFHSACVRILRRNADRLGFSDSFTIYDTNDSQTLMKQIVKDLNLDEKSFPFKSLLNEISRLKDQEIGPQDYCTSAETSGDIRRINIGKAYKEYTRRLFAANAMDFDDLLYFTVMLLEQEEDVREYWQKRFRYIMIDEYQDTNHLQYRFARLMSGGNNNLCVVGDDDQSIYKFRGATIENILSFEQEYKKCRTIRLEQNYRSTGNILAAANAVIRNNVGRKGKELWTDHGSGDPLVLFTADNENAEAQYVASQILAAFSRGESWSENAILYRMNAQSNQLEYAFKRNGIPYRIIGGMRYFDRAEVKDILAYLNIISDSRDTLRLKRIINVPVRGIGAKSVDTAEEIAYREGKTLFDILRQADHYSDLTRAALKMREFANMIEDLQAYAADHTPEQLLEQLLDKTGYIRALEEKDSVENQSRIENVNELKTSILEYRKESGDDTLAGYLANVSLYTDLDNYDTESDTVVMMTMHSAKGLEFPNVYLVGMEETIFPGARCIGEPEEMEEERRLCYVALTRAKKQLTLTCARQRMLFGRTTANKVSRFVEEIPEELIRKKGAAGFGSRASSYGSGSGDYGRRDSYGGSAYSNDSYGKKSYSGSTYGSSSYAASYSQGNSGGTLKTGLKPPTPAAKAAPAADAEGYAPGARIVHKAFGQGTIKKMTPMGGDSLIEIEFDDGKTKRLMLRALAQLMKPV